MRFLLAVGGALGVLLIYDGITAGRPRPRVDLLRALDRLVSEAGVKRLTASRLLLLSGGSGIIAFTLVVGLTASPPVAFALGVPAAWVPVAMLRTRRRDRRRRFRDAWPDAIATLIASVRAGSSLPEACDSLVARGPADLAPSFRAFSGTFRATGSFRAGLVRLRAELSDPIGDRVIATLALAHEVGGSDLVRVLRTLSDFVRDDLRIRKEIEARWSWTVTAARVAAAAPWLVLLLMATRPEAAAAYNSAQGTGVIAVGLTATIVGYRLMLRAARLPEQRRLGT